MPKAMMTKKKSRYGMHANCKPYWAMPVGRTSLLPYVGQSIRASRRVSM